MKQLKIAKWWTCEKKYLNSNNVSLLTTKSQTPALLLFYNVYNVIWYFIYSEQFWHCCNLILFWNQYEIPVFGWWCDNNCWGQMAARTVAQFITDNKLWPFVTNCVRCIILQPQDVFLKNSTRMYTALRWFAVCMVQ